jgi:hypothetical protein
MCHFSAYACGKDSRRTLAQPLSADNRSLAIPNEADELEAGACLAAALWWMLAPPD